jgi:hypothetical protein
MFPYFFYFGIYPLLLLLSIYIGKKTVTRIDKYANAWRPIGLESSLIGFYALLTSFTLVQSSNSARDREQMIQTVADDISEILRITLIDETTLHDKVHVYFSDFTKIIEQSVKPDTQAIKASIEAIDVLDDNLNNFMKLYIQVNPSARERIGTILSRIDRMESNYYQLLHSFQRRLPSVILFVLIFFSMLIGYLMGYMEKSHGNNFRITTFIFVVMSIIIINVIHDLDDPSVGFLTPNFDDIKAVIENFHAVK